MDNEFFDPEKLKSSFSDSIPETETLPNNVEFGFAIPLLHETEKRKSYWDVFVDDLINILLKNANVEAKAKEAAAIALEILFRPLAEKEHIKRNTILKLSKLLAEGGLKEVKIVLGWLFNTRLFRIYIPDEKGRRWLYDLNSIIDKGHARQWVTKDELESLIGKLNEAAHICNEGRFFLARVRNGLSRAETYKKAKLNSGEILDLELWTVLLKTLMHEGRSLNHVNPTIPSLFLKQDASSEEGIGGFNDLGFAWRYTFDTAIKGNDFIHINTWEQLAGVVNIWYAIILLDIQNGQGMKFLDQSDNMTAIKWMLTSKYYDSKEHVQSILREKISRKLAEILLLHDVSIYTQHIPGVENEIADALSRNKHLSNHAIISKIKQLDKPNPVKDEKMNLVVTDLPEIIFSWIESIVLEATQLMELPKELTTKIKLGLENGRNSQKEPMLTLSFGGTSIHSPG